MSVLILLSAAVLAGFCQGLTGFGFALVFTPFATLLLPARQVVITALVTGLFLTAVVAWQARSNVSWQKIWLLIIGGGLSTPVGILLLISVGYSILRILVACVATASAIALLVRRPNPLKGSSERLAQVIVGLVGGFLNGATSMGGGLPALLVTTQEWNVASSRAALLFFNLVSYLLAIIAFVAAGALDTFRLQTLILMPAAAVGALSGAFVARRIVASAFYKTIIITVGVTAVARLIGYWLH